MHLTPLLLTLLTTLASTKALPQPDPDIDLDRRTTVAAHTQSCHVASYALPGAPTRSYYTVNIGEPFVNGRGCNNVHQALANNGVFSAASAAAWSCRDNGSGQTVLEITCVPGLGHTVNRVLQQMYPQVRGGFNCPDS